MILQFTIKVLLAAMVWLATLLLPGIASAQILQAENQPETITLHLPETPDSEAEIIAREKVHELHSKGFLKATLDSVVTNTSYSLAYINQGPRFYYVLSPGDINIQLLQSLKLDEYVSGEPIRFETFDKLSQNLLAYYENNGYPFARLHKTQVDIRPGQISALLNADPMEFITFDSISIVGNVNIQAFFLENHLGIAPGQPYSQKKLELVQAKISELDFVRLNGPLQLSYSPTSARLTIPLEKNNASRFDGIVGFSSTEAQESALQVTGMLNLFLVNAFGMGEYIDMSWQGPGNKSQILNLSGGYPYPFRLPIKTEFMFGLHRQDSTWLQLSARPSLITENPAGSWGVFLHYTRGSLISTTQYQQTTTPPANLDFSSRLYGLEYRRRTPAFRQNLLQQGYSLKFSGAGGNRIIHRNSQLPEIIYEKVELKSLQLNASARAEKRWSLSERSTLSLSTQMAYMNGDEIPENQLFRLGGFNSLKGFDEWSLLASAYALGNAEYRFFTGSRSFFSLLVNGGWYESRGRAAYVNDYPMGAGAGINLETQAGIFALYFALGSSRNIPLEFRNGKIHIGYVSTF